MLASMCKLKVGRLSREVDDDDDDDAEYADGMHEMMMTKVKDKL